MDMETNTKQQNSFCRENQITYNKIDFHSHILPKLDDGSDSIKTSIIQLSMAKNADIQIVCATPHFYPHQIVVEEFLRKRDQSFSRLLQALPDNTPEIRLGAELLTCEGIDRLENIQLLCLSGTEYLLFEMPMTRWSTGIIDSSLNLLNIKGITPVLAHADRYDPYGVKIFTNAGIKLQINIENYFHPLKGRQLRHWVDEDLVLAFGSDIHRTEKAYKKWKKLKGESIIKL